MNKEELKERIKVEQAYINGAKIEFTEKNHNNWDKVHYPTFNWIEYDYRISFTLEYVPFTFEDDLIGKSVKHKIEDIKSLVISTEKHKLCLGNVGYISYQELFEYWTFIDGTPCGKLQKNN